MYPTGPGGECELAMCGSNTHTHSRFRRLLRFLRGLRQEKGVESPRNSLSTQPGRLFGRRPRPAAAQCEWAGGGVPGAREGWSRKMEEQRTPVFGGGLGGSNGICFFDLDRPTSVDYGFLNGAELEDFKGLVPTCEPRTLWISQTLPVLSGSLGAQSSRARGVLGCGGHAVRLRALGSLV